MDLIVKEQFINACSEELAVYLLERGPKDLVEITTWAQQYLIAHKQHQEMKTGKSSNQLVIPKKLQQQVISLNHESAFSGHLGAKKIEVRILPNFFWPVLGQDVITFCRFCDVCQRTFKKGNVKKVPLGSMPLINTPFKRVAVDIVGPIVPLTEAGHRYILTLVNYATRYPEAVPLKKITTEAVAVALVDIYSRVGIRKEVLTDQGTQFMSECMQKVSRLLSIKGLTSTPYHPICNGLVERWNGTITFGVGLCAMSVVSMESV